MQSMQVAADHATRARRMFSGGVCPVGLRTHADSSAGGRDAGIGGGVAGSKLLAALAAVVSVGRVVRVRCRERRRRTGRSVVCLREIAKLAKRLDGPTAACSPSKLSGSREPRFPTHHGTQGSTRPGEGVDAAPSLSAGVASASGGRMSARMRAR